MTVLVRRFRGIGVAVAAVALTAGVALAAAGPANLHLAPAGANGPAATREPDESEAPEGSEAPDANGASGDAHGALVSAAAQMTTPPGFANHGQFVSCVAHMKGVTLATINWSTVTPTSCAAAAPGDRPTGH